MEQKRKRTHGHGQQCGDCWGSRVDGGGRGDKRHECNEKNAIK